MEELAAFNTKTLGPTKSKILKGIQTQSTSTLSLTMKAHAANNLKKMSTTFTSSMLKNTKVRPKLKECVQPIAQNQDH